MLPRELQNSVSNHRVQLMPGGIISRIGLGKIGHVLVARSKFIVAFEHLMQRHKNHRAQLIEQITVAIHRGANARGDFLLGGLAIEFDTQALEAAFQLATPRIHRARKRLRLAYLIQNSTSNAHARIRLKGDAQAGIKSVSALDEREARNIFQVIHVHRHLHQGRESDAPFG